MKNRYYRILSLVLVAVVLMSFTACGKKEALTANQFKTFMEEKGLEVIDQTASAENDDYQNVYVAVDLEKYSFEYYFMRNDLTAKSLYTFAVEKVKENYKEAHGVTTTEKSFPSSADYSVTASDYYVRVIRVDNAVLYVTSYLDNKDECKEIIKEMGY